MRATPSGSLQPSPPLSTLVQATHCAHSCHRSCFPSRGCAWVPFHFYFCIWYKIKREKHTVRSQASDISANDLVPSRKPPVPSVLCTLPGALASTCRNLQTDASDLGGFQLFLLASREQSALDGCQRGRAGKKRTSFPSCCSSPAITIMAGVSLPGLAPPENVKPFPNWTCCSRAA